MKIEIPERVYRAGQFERDSVNAEDRTIELSFSSEAPCSRWWGVEVLGHKRGEMDESWIGSGRAPLLVDHVANVDAQVGTVVKAWVEGGKGRAVVRFGKSARATEIMQRVIDGELSSISVGYEIRSMSLVSEKDGVGTYRATSWKPLEVSLVSVPADDSVGVGRSLEGGTRSLIIEGTESMLEENQQARTAPVAATVAATPAAPDVNAILANERKRVSEIEAIAAQFNVRDKVAKAIADGMTVDAFRGAVLDHLGAERAQQALTAHASLGMTEKEKRQFSFVRAIAALANPNVAALQDAAGYEREVSTAYNAKIGRASRGITIPVDVLHYGQRDLTVGTNADGGYTVATDLLGGSFIDLLRNRLAVLNMGATMMTDLNGNIAIPRQTGGATAYWVAESGAPTESKQAFDQVTMTPKTVAAFTDYSRRLSLQSSVDVEAFVRRDLAAIAALEIDRAAIHGSGSSNQPTGIVATSGIGSVAGGTNGLAPAWSHIIALETAVATANADIGTLGYLTNAKVRGKLKTVEKAASSAAQFIWEKGGQPGEGEMNGYRARVTNQVSSTLTKGTSSGVCSAILFGNWADLFIGMWSGLDLMVDPYTGSSSATVRVTAFQDIDIAVRHPESFAAMLDALTT